MGLQVLERQLAHGKPYLLGADLTLADFYLVPCTFSFSLTDEGKAMYPKYPGFCRWRETMEALPTVQTFSSFAAAARADRARQGVGRVASPEILRAGQCREAPIVLLSGRDLRRLLRPETTIAALRETYAALADNRGDQGRSVGFTVEGGSIHVKSGLLPGSHLAFASKVNVNLPENAKLRGLPTIQGIVVRL